MFSPFVQKLKDAGYHVTYETLQVADYGVPQSRRRLVLLAGRGFPISLPKATYSREPEGRLKPWRTVREAIEHLGDAVTLQEAMESGGPSNHDWHVVRTLSPLNQKRLAATTPGSSRSELPKRLRPKCHKDSDKGFQNVYGRMAWDQPSPTITGGCTTLSKGRFGHPEQQRTISLREAALLQTFPAEYKFPIDYMEHACKIVGNALPCEFARRIAVRCHAALKKADTL